MNVQLIHIATSLDAPIPMRVDCEMSKLTIICGENESGKSLIMKMSWALGTLLSMITTREIYLGDIQWLWDHTFSDQNFNGTIKATFENNTILELHIDNGLVTDLLTDNLPVEFVQAPLFLSTNMRLWDAKDRYLADRNRCNADIMELAKTYPLYDIMYMEQFIKQLPLPGEKIDRLNDMLHNSMNFKHTISNIGISYSDCHFYCTLEDNTVQRISSFGNGVQAIITMFSAIP